MGTAAVVGLTGLSSVAAAETITVDPGSGSSLDAAFMDAVERASSGDTIDVASGTYTVDSISNDGKALNIVGGDVVLKVSSGGTALRLSGNNWTFDGFGFDYQHTSSPPSINLSGSGWTFANTVFWNTKLPSSDTNDLGAVIYPNVSSGGTGVIRNCYLHDGAVDPDGYADFKALWAGGDNIAGSLLLDGVWCEEWAENTLYVSNNSGSIEVRNSYFRNTNVSGPRNTDPALVENCTFVLDGKPPKQYRNGKTGSRSVRGVWWNAEKGYYGSDVTVRNCDFAWKAAGDAYANNPIDASDGDGGTLRIESCNFLNETGATTILNEGHNLETSDNTFGSADTTPPIPSPPGYGTTPGSTGSGTDGSGGGSYPPSYDLSLAEVETTDGDAAFDAAWSVSDSDGDLASVDLTLTDTTDGATEDTASIDVSGSSASSTTRLVAAGDDGAGHDYQVELVVTDAAGNTTTGTASATESEPVTIEDVWQDDALNEVVFQSTRDDTSDYRMAVEGTVEPGENANLDDGTDQLLQPSDGEYVVDALVGGGGFDNWWVDGHVSSLAVEDGIDITVNGVAFTADEIEGVGSAISVDSLSLGEVETDNGDAAFDAAWSVSDSDGDLASVDLTLTDTTDGATEDTASIDVSGSSASSTTRLTAAGDDGAGHDYQVELVVTDGTGDVSTSTATATEEETTTIEDVWQDDALNEVVFQSTRDDTSDYRMAVEGTVEPGENANLDDGTDQLLQPSDGEYVVDALVGGGGFDNWWVDGHVSSLAVEDGIDITVNGVAFTADEIEGVGTAPAADPSIDNWVDGEFNRVELSGDSTSTYEFVVAGAVKPGPGTNLADGTDKLVQSGTDEFTVRGSLSGGADAWDVKGQVVSAAFDSGVSMTVNGTAYDAALLEGTGSPVTGTSLPNTVVVDSPNGKAQYEFTVSDRVVFSTAGGATAEADDVIDDRTVTGSVHGGTDAYAFSGDVTDFSLKGQADVTIDDNN